MLIAFSRLFFPANQLGKLLRLLTPIICFCESFIILSGLSQSAPTSHKLVNFHLFILFRHASFNRLLVASLLNQIIAILIAPYFIDAHGKLIVSVRHDRLKVQLLAVNLAAS